MTFKVATATNVVASRPPERRPTGTLHTCANRDPDVVFSSLGAYSFILAVILNNIILKCIHQ